MAKPMTRPAKALILLATLVLAACQSGAPVAQDMVQRSASTQAPLAGAAEAGCWATDTVPAHHESVMETVVITPAVLDARGREVQPAVIAQGPHLAQVRPAEDRLFAVPCPEVMNAEFVAALQRALSVRGFYAGAATGAMDDATRAAVRAYQRPQGLDSTVLSLTAAQQLGLIALPRSAY